MRVLIADSDNQLLETLQSFLWDRGHEAEGIMRRIREDSKLSQTPVILLTSDQLPHEFESMATLLTVRRLYKPLRLNDLLDQLESIDSALRSTKDRAAPAAAAG
jgi:DNA-binding response OmpR family regulator